MEETWRSGCGCLAVPVGLETLLEISNCTGCLELLKDPQTQESILSAVWKQKISSQVRWKRLGARVVAALFGVAPRRVLEALRPALEPSNPHLPLALDVAMEISLLQDGLDLDLMTELASDLVAEVEAIASLRVATPYLNSVSSLIRRLGPKAEALARRVSESLAPEKFELMASIDNL
eukprot:TRINITY_DN6688_c0_g1_i1.p1 TRINITY_DN6688_c0_g1~~TRINITY_DN6688_c0_g1_i1.p1  ORF type:complete len:178 (-),score=22.34 TRINITY_DN6688_c0_g1_i1:403-936(-)